VSTQPFYGGPVYVVRNEIYGLTALPLKLHNYCAGLEVYHNTLVSAGVGFQSYDRWQNGQFRNNLFLGGRDAATMTTGTVTAYSSLDYNGYRRNGGETFIRWFDGVARKTYDSLEEFRAGTGHEVHGRMVDYDIFVRGQMPERGRTVTAGEWDLRLRPGSAAVDAGVDLAGINDGFRGRAPDLGAHELGAPAPHYGPRPQPAAMAK
jgi:hypothetical protein